MLDNEPSPKPSFLTCALQPNLGSHPSTANVQHGKFQSICSSKWCWSREALKKGARSPVRFLHKTSLLYTKHPYGVIELQGPEWWRNRSCFGQQGGQAWDDSSVYGFCAQTQVLSAWNKGRPDRVNLKKFCSQDSLWQVQWTSDWSRLICRCALPFLRIGPYWRCGHTLPARLRGRGQSTPRWGKSTRTNSSHCKLFRWSTGSSF